MIIIECIIVIISTIGLFFIGIFIGRNFVTFENFILHLLELLRKKLK